MCLLACRPLSSWWAGSVFRGRGAGISGAAYQCRPVSWWSDSACALPGPCPLSSTAPASPAASATTSAARATSSTGSACCRAQAWAANAGTRRPRKKRLDVEVADSTTGPRLSHLPRIHSCQCLPCAFLCVLLARQLSPLAFARLCVSPLFRLFSRALRQPVYALVLLGLVTCPSCAATFSHTLEANSSTATCPGLSF